MDKDFKSLKELNEFLLTIVNDQDNIDFRDMQGLGGGSTHLLVWKKFPYQAAIEIEQFSGNYILSYITFYQFFEESSTSKPNLRRGYKLDKDVLQLEEIKPIFQDLVTKIYYAWIY
jgi:hypothetical protein